MINRLSASGARIRGDDYQHLFAWIQVLRALLPGNRVLEVGIEDPDAGNADDVTLYKENQEQEYFQVKSSVDAREPMDINWLMKPSRTGGPSVIQRFYRLWAQAPIQRKPELTLVTNRPAADADPILRLRDGRDGKVAEKLRIQKPKSKARITLTRLAEHLGISEDEALAFLSNLRFLVGRLYDEWKEPAATLMYVAGLRNDEDAVTQGISIVRGWVTAGKRKLSLAELRETVKPLERPGELPSASLLIQVIDRDPLPESALIALDWVDHFPGDEPRIRRCPSDDTLWNKQFRPQLQQAAQELKARGCTDVLVRGYMRLPTWFATGVELGRTAGFQVVSFQNGEPWSSRGEYPDFPLDTIIDKVGEGKDLAVSIALATNPSSDVLRYLAHKKVEVGHHVCIRPKQGTSNHLIRSAVEARGWAYQVREDVRCIVREYRPATIHLFLATPRGGALLLGHFWDRMPPTQLYEDLGPGNGYSPSFLIPN